MRYLMMSMASDTAPDESLYADMDRFIQELTASGVLLATGGLAPEGVRMTSSGGEITVTDGPFTEAKEVIGGYAMIQAKSRDEAVEWASRFLAIHGEEWELEAEVRQVEEAS